MTLTYRAYRAARWLRMRRWTALAMGALAGHGARHGPVVAFATGCVTFVIGMLIGIGISEFDRDGNAR